MALRVIHQFQSEASTEALSEYASKLRSALKSVEAEHYRSIQDASHHTLLEVWADETVYAAHWAGAISDAGNDIVLSERMAAGNAAVPAEFYAQRYYRLDGAWRPDDAGEASSPIVWPAAGGVRVVLQLCLELSDRLLTDVLADQRDTAMEPGCVQYGGSNPSIAPSTSCFWNSGAASTYMTITDTSD